MLGTNFNKIPELNNNILETISIVLKGFRTTEIISQEKKLSSEKQFDTPSCYHLERAIHGQNVTVPNYLSDDVKQIARQI